MNNSLQDFFNSDQWEKNSWEPTNGNNFDELFFDSSLELITSIDNLVSEQNLFSDFKKPKLQYSLEEINSEPKQEPIFKKKFKTIPKKTISKMPEFDLDLIQELNGLQTLSHKEINEITNIKNSTQLNRATTTSSPFQNLLKKNSSFQNKSAFSMPSSSSSTSSTSSPTTTLNSKNLKTNGKYSSLQVQPHKHTIRKRRKTRKKKYQSTDSNSQTPIVYVDGKNLLAKMSQEQLNKLSNKQRKLRKIYKNRLAAKRSADRIKKKINFLGEKTSQLLQKNQNLNREITQTKMERDQLMERASELEKELKELREKEKEGDIEKEKEKEKNPKLETLTLFGSIRNAIESLSTIPSYKNQTEEEMILPSTINFMDQKWGTIKKKLVKNTNNRTGFAMMIVILAITFFFGNEMIFGSSTSFSIPFFSDDADYTRNLKSLDYLRKTAMENWGGSNNIVLIEEVKQLLKDSDSDTDMDIDVDPSLRKKVEIDSNLNPSQKSEQGHSDCNFKKSKEERKDIVNVNENENENENENGDVNENENENENGDVNKNENEDLNQNSKKKFPIDLFRNNGLLENSKNSDNPKAEKTNENQILPQ
ncbi:fos transcription factor-related [Anaeramoeba flamelloides]|uniref:Fos transcription factor-related n=1 Tax=Anaeramoeba flamelloides TaxID=1746091 RepID=A0AAV8A3S2_9EUKA|nr:fos transcription factor-related [Anaeramoeba flamelloides]